MDNETHFSIVFNIYGGSNQILPNATSATQNYYGDEAELEKDDVSKDKEPALSPEATRLFSYINKVEDLRIYLVQIAECTNAVELARVIVKMGEREPKITSEEMVKERFISLFFPLTPLFVSGKTVSNIRARINNAWARRQRWRKFWSVSFGKIRHFALHWRRRRAKPRAACSSRSSQARTTKPKG